MSPISAPSAREPPQAERRQEAMVGAVLSCSGRAAVTSSTRADTAAVVAVDTAGILISDICSRGNIIDVLISQST